MKGPRDAKPRELLGCFFHPTSEVALQNPTKINTSDFDLDIHREKKETRNLLTLQVREKPSTCSHLGSQTLHKNPSHSVAFF